MLIRVHSWLIRIGIPPGPVVWIALLLPMGWTPGFAAAPVLDHIFPAALQVGTTNAVTFIGKFDPWPPQVWSDATGVTFEPTTNQGVFTVTVAAQASPGPSFVRAFNREGVSVPRFLIIATEPQVPEVEPNHERTKPQLLERLPVTLNGRLEKNGDVDAFAIHLDAGQTLMAWLEAYTLMSPLDPVLQLLDPRGVLVAWNHDDGRSLDPFLAWTANAPGTHVLRVFGFAYPADSDIRFSGNARGVYRLHATAGPLVRHTFPLGVRRGENTALRLRGWNLGGNTNREVVFDGHSLRAEIRRVPFLPPGTENPIELPVGDGPELLESEPNSGSGEANPLEVPGAVTGDLSRPGDVDRFAFAAKKGERLLLEIQSASLGLPLDAWLAVEASSGQELVRNDDAAGADPRLEWTAPEDGRYLAAVGNLLQQGGEDQWYRLEVRRALPALKVTVAENAFALEPGKTNEVKVSVTRQHGFAAKLNLSARGLPEGVLAEAGEVSETGGEAVIRLVAAAGAPPFSGPIRIVAIEAESGREQDAVMELVSAGENNGVPQGFRRLVRESISQFWLTVLSVPKLAEEKK